MHEIVRPIPLQAVVQQVHVEHMQGDQQSDHDPIGISEKIDFLQLDRRRSGHFGEETEDRPEAVDHELGASLDDFKETHSNGVRVTI